MIKDPIKHVEPDPVKENNRKCSIHESYKVFRNTNSSSMAKNDVQDTILEIDLTMCPPFAGIKQTGMESTLDPVEVNLLNRKKRRRKNRKKKTNVLQNSGQVQKLPEEGCPTSINHMSSTSELSISADDNCKVLTSTHSFSMPRSEVEDTISGVEQTSMEATQNPAEVNLVSRKKRRMGSPMTTTNAQQNNGQGQKLLEQGFLTSTNHMNNTSTRSLSGERNGVEKAVSLGTDENSPLSVINSSQSLSHGSYKVFSNTSSSSMAKSEEQGTILGVEFTLCSPFDRIEQMGVETTQDLVEVNLESQKRKKKKNRKKPPKALQNSGQSQKLLEEGCLTSTNHMNIMSTSSLSAEKNNGGNISLFGTEEINTSPVANSSQSLSHENHKVNVNSFSMSRSDAQDTVPGVDSALCPSISRIEERGMEATQNPVEVNPGSLKKRRKSRKKKHNALQNSGQPQQLPEERFLTSTNHMNIMSTVGLSDKRNSEGKVISLGTDETNTFAVTNSSQGLSHENLKHFNNANSFLMTKSEVQDTTPGADSTLCPPFDGIDQCRETTQNPVEVNPVCKKKKRRRNRKKHPDALQNGGQTQKLPEEGCLTIANHKNIISTVSSLDERNTEEKVISLGTGETNSFSVTNSSASLSRENSKVFSNTYSLPIMCPPLAEIERVGLETTKNPVEVNMVIKKRKKRKRNKKKEPNTLHNGGQAQKLGEDSCPTSTNDMHIMSNLSLSDEKNGEEKFFAPAGDKIEQVCVAVADEGDKNSEISHISLLRAPVGHLRKKLLILDINGVLADIVLPAPKNCKPDFKFAGRALFKRPFYQDFLKFCFERFEVGVWSSRAKKNVTRVIDYLMGGVKRKLLLCWDRSHCTPTKFKTLEDKHKPVVLKELTKIWEKHDPSLPWKKGDYNQSNTLLLDDSPYKALLNPPHTAIFPDSFNFQNTGDKSLGAGGELRVYLEGLAEAENVQNYVRENPFGQRAITERNASWEFYERIINSLKS
ncbi:uncharacterized protein LOC115976278 isoform X2 [Quercus lobata]|uniref:uncharacterized protein LOC115976278 isoform X2 n=1 Tax=Quercus lobata TaxID=97700 RepID=UPI0012473399|nr:uncharacterized protein LOC115976278 isoform X2 [Quercus lobata]